MPIRFASFLLIAALILSPHLTGACAGQSPGGSRQSIVWTHTVNCAATGNGLRKTAGRDDTSD
ncbi:MAG TPA: hypothetical protein VNI02_15495, partial [Blastocatellia bacterium]|nr:hypothetical protein [Blastocatellia bacterium]